MSKTPALTPSPRAHAEHGSTILGATTAPGLGCGSDGYFENREDWRHGARTFIAKINGGVGNVSIRDTFTGAPRPPNASRVRLSGQKGESGEPPMWLAHVRWPGDDRSFHKRVNYLDGAIRGNGAPSRFPVLNRGGIVPGAVSVPARGFRTTRRRSATDDQPQPAKRPRRRANGRTVRAAPAREIRILPRKLEIPPPPLQDRRAKSVIPSTGPAHEHKTPDAEVDQESDFVACAQCARRRPGMNDEGDGCYYCVECWRSYMIEKTASASARERSLRRAQKRLLAENVGVRMASPEGRSESTGTPTSLPGLVRDSTSQSSSNTSDEVQYSDSSCPSLVNSGD